MGTITQSYVEGLTKQIFIRDYILNGLFPNQSAVCRMIRNKKKEWKFNDKFEYRMMLSNSNTGGTINTQVFDRNFALQQDMASIEYGVFQATYGTIMDGFTIDMTKQLETKDNRAAFNLEYALKLHSMRINVASIFKNLTINGRYGVIHRIGAPLNTTTTGNINGYTPTGTDSKTKVDDFTANGRNTTSLYHPEIYIPLASEFGPNAAYDGSSPNANATAGGYNTFRMRPDGWVKLPLFNRTGSGAGHDDYCMDPTWEAGDYYPMTYSRSEGGIPSFDALGTLRRGTMLKLKVPFNVYHSNFKKGRLVTFAQYETQPGVTETSDLFSAGRFAPWGKSYVDNMWVIYDNQPRSLTLCYIGPSCTGSKPSGVQRNSFNNLYVGSYLVLAGNRHAVDDSWGGISDKSYLQRDSIPSSGYANPSFMKWQVEAAETGPRNYAYSERTGAMEGLADLFPWYTTVGATDPTSGRLGLDRDFRGQPNRLVYTAEQAGMLYLQQPNEPIIDAIMSGVTLAQGTTPYADLCVWMNPDTLQAIGYSELHGTNPGLTYWKESQLDSKLTYQRGITATSYRMGSKVIPNTVVDYNIPTDVIIIAPQFDCSYNCWDNSAFELDKYIVDTFSNKEPPRPENLQIPKDLATRLDISARITYGAPVADNIRDTYFNSAGINSIIHPSNSLPVAYHEMGALFTENPYAYTVIKLRNQIVQDSDVRHEMWDNVGIGA